jgi:subtilisin family serine protease
MFKYSRSFLLIAMLFSFFIVESFSSNINVKKDYVPGQILVKFKQSMDILTKSPMYSSFSDKYKIQKIQKAFPNKRYDPNLKVGMVDLSAMVVLTVTATTDIERLVKQMYADPLIEYAGPNYLVTMDAIPNDPLYPQLQHLPQVKASQAWDISQGDTNVVIAVLDTGVDWDHPDLAISIWRNFGEIPDNGIDDDGNGFIDDIRGWDFVTGVTSGGDPRDDLDSTDNNPMDFNGHGSHVAGISAAITNNGVGISSLSYKAKIMPLRIGYHTADGNGTGQLLWMAQAFVYAGDNGAHVANLSFGTGEGTFVIDAARYAFLKGTVICHSAGNGNNDAVGALGATPFALSVASVNESDVKASYSTYGKEVDISAPGGDFSPSLGILSTIVNPSPLYGGSLYVRFSGTSMASPFVGSLAGLIKAQHPDWSPAQINFQICGTADNIDGVNPNFIGKLGSGRINAFRALTETIAPPQPRLVLKDYSFFEISGDMDQNFEPGETIGLKFTIENQWGDAYNTSATLSSISWAISFTNPITNMGTVNGINDLLNSTKVDSSIAFQIHPEALPEVITLNLTITADGDIKSYEIQLPLNPSILLVEDNDGQVGLNEYIDAIKSMGAVYRHWDRETQGSPSPEVMQKYSTVVWFADLYVHPYLDSADRANLGTHLDNGGNLFIAGMDYGWDMCAPPPSGTVNEYLLSNGASKIWYENYLKATYLADGTSYRAVNGVGTDTISKGLSFSFDTPWPSVIDTLHGSLPVFAYPDKSLCGIRYDGDYRLIYLSFGSLENISDQYIRRTIFERSLSWMTGYNISVSRVGDTEDISIPLPVDAFVSSRDLIQNVYLAWAKNGERPYHKILMTQVSPSNYHAEIPPAIQPGDFEYRIIAETNKGILPNKTYTFRAGPDIQPPVISLTNPVPPSLKLTGPYKASVQVTDNIAVNKDSAFIHYKKFGDENELRVNLRYWGENTFTDTFSLKSPAIGGQKIEYYFTARDSSSNLNLNRYPESGYLSFIIGREIVEKFEEGTSNWNLGQGWTLTDTFKNSGKYSITDSPLGKYLPNIKDTCTMIQAIDLSPFSGGWLKYWIRRGIHRGDTVFIDISRNATEWEPIKFYRTGFPAGANITQFDSVSVNQYFGSGNQSVSLRFRIQTDSIDQADGVYFDDIEFISTESTLDVKNEERLPNDFRLSQNYPNPFNPTTIINYQLPMNSYVTLKVYNILGQEVATLVNEIQDAGYKQAVWNATNNYGNKVTSGVYFYRIDIRENSQSGKSYTEVKKMLIIK